MIQYWEILAFWQLFCFFVQDSSSPPSVNNSVSQHACGKSLVLSCFADLINLGQWKWY